MMDQILRRCIVTQRHLRKKWSQAISKRAIACWRLDRDHNVEQETQQRRCSAMLVQAGSVGKTVSPSGPPEKTGTCHSKGVWARAIQQLDRGSSVSQSAIMSRAFSTRVAIMTCRALAADTPSVLISVSMRGKRKQKQELCSLQWQPWQRSASSPAIGALSGFGAAGAGSSQAHTCEQLGVAGDVGLDAQAVRGGQGAEPPNAGEHFVEDDGHAAGPALGGQAALVQRVHQQHAAGTLQQKAYAVFAAGVQVAGELLGVT